MHQAMVHVDGRKMSKSTGNLVFVADLRQRHEGAAIRLALSVHHYRRPWNWTDGLLGEAEERLARGGLRALRRWTGGDAAALDDDLDLPGALAVIDAAASKGCGVDQAARLLGIAVMWLGTARRGRIRCRARLGSAQELCPAKPIKGCLTTSSAAG